jgi:hypothetical protein
VTFAKHASNLTNAEIAASLEYNAVHARTSTARAIMQEAARRLRDHRETQLVDPPSPDNPPLKAEAD